MNAIGFIPIVSATNRIPTKASAIPRARNLAMAAEARDGDSCQSPGSSPKVRERSQVS